MTVHIVLRCPGPDGSGNGCPEAILPVEGQAAASHDAIRQVWGDLLEKALTGSFIRCPWDQAVRCRSCARRGPGTIAGIALRLWEQALARYERGEPPSVWGGKDGLPTARQWNNAIHRVDWLAARIGTMASRRLQVPRARQVDEGRWPQVIDRFMAGEDKDDICTGQDGWPTKKQWNGKMDRDSGFRTSILAEWDRRRAAEERKIDAILIRFEAGEALRPMLDGGLRSRWSVRLGADQPFRERVLSQHAKNRNSAWGRANLEALMVGTIRFIAGGGRSANLPGMPTTLSKGHHHRLVAVNPVYGAAYEAALEASGGTKRKGFNRFLDWDGAITDFSKGMDVKQVCADAGRPSSKQWAHRLKVDAGFAALVDGERLRRREETAAKKRAAAAKKVDRSIWKPDVQIGERFRATLNQNEMYAAINRAVPLALPGHIRDDVVGEMVLAVLEGDLDLGAVQSKAREYLRRYDRAHETWKNVSLDAPIAGTDSLRLIDRFSNEDRLW